MALDNANGRYVHTIWCDDIRQEVGNKPSFMGVYTAGIFLQSLPVVLPRLAAYVWVTTPIDRRFQKLNIRGVRDDGFVLFEVLQETPVGSADVFQSSRPDSTRQVAMAGFAFGGVEVPVGCKYFSVVVETESETLEGPRLRIDVASELAQNSLGDPSTSGLSDTSN